MAINSQDSIWTPYSDITPRPKPVKVTVELEKDAEDKRTIQEIRILLG